MNSYRETHYLTAAGLERLKRELKRLVNARSLKSADSEELSRVSERIKEIGLILRNYELIKVPPKEKQGIVQLGATVVVEVDGQTDELVIVGSIEANPSLGKISYQSPVGQALLNRKVGETVIVASAVKTVYLIKDIKYLE